MKLTFDTEQKANSALDLINDNKGYSRCSTNAASGKEDNKVQATNEWDKVKKAYNLDLWYFSKPEDEFMTNVIAYEEQEMNPIWVEPVEI